MQEDVRILAPACGIAGHPAPCLIDKEFIMPSKTPTERIIAASRRRAVQDPVRYIPARGYARGEFRIGAESPDDAARALVEAIRRLAAYYDSDAAPGRRGVGEGLAVRMVIDRYRRLIVALAGPDLFSPIHHRALKRLVRNAAKGVQHG